MTGNDIYEKAVVLLGFSDSAVDFTDDTALRERTLAAINEIGHDLCEMPPKKSLFDKLEVEENIANAMCYGVAMMVSLIEGDGVKNSVFTEIYNSKRATVKSQIAFRVDTLPKGGAH